MGKLICPKFGCEVDDSSRCCVECVRKISAKKGAAETDLYSVSEDLIRYGEKFMKRMEDKRRQDV